MLKLESFYHLHEAQMLVDELASAQIAAFVSSDRRGASGALPFTQAFCEVWLESDSDLEPARELLKEFVGRSKDNENATVDCPRCAQENPVNFGLCWSCGNELPSAGVNEEPYREAEGPKKAAPRKKKTTEQPEADGRRLTQRVVPAGRSTIVRALWAASALIPSGLMWIQGKEAGAAILGLATATVLWWLSGSKAPDYCRACHAPMVGYNVKCEECGRKLEGELTESAYASQGGEVPKAGMREAIVVSFAAVVLLAACAIAFAAGDEPQGGMRRYHPPPTKPF